MVYSKQISVRITSHVQEESFSDHPHIKMPKKKTGQRKKAEKQKERQRTIRTAHADKSIAERACNALMVGQY